MLSLVRKDIEKINNLSKQLLLDVERLTDEQNDVENISHTNTEHNLSSLISERHALVIKLFEAHSLEQLSTEIGLINEMLSFDEQLTAKLTARKKVLAQEVIKMKKSKKIKDIYKSI